MHKVDAGVLIAGMCAISYLKEYLNVFPHNFIHNLLKMLIHYLYQPEVISVPLFRASISAALASSSEGPEEGGGAFMAGGGGGGGGPGGGGTGAPPVEPLTALASPPCKTQRYL